MNLKNTHKDSLSEDICVEDLMMIYAANIAFIHAIFNQSLILIEDKVL